jgi:Domain of unknown function (DUF4157)
MHPFKLIRTAAAKPAAPAPAGQIQRCGGVQCAPGSCDHADDQDGSVVHRSAATPGETAAPGATAIPPSVHRVLATPGTALDPGTRTNMQARIGHDFGQVRVHADVEAARSAQDIAAYAYTFGRHVVMGADRYQPHTPDGRHLLAHELTHVAQQAGDPGMPRSISRQLDPSETEAEDLAGKATRAQEDREHARGPLGR